MIYSEYAAILIVGFKSIFSEMVIQGQLCIKSGPNKPIHLSEIKPWPQMKGSSLSAKVNSSCIHPFIHVAN
jgi:hypothetical protein